MRGFKSVDNPSSEIATHHTQEGLLSNSKISVDFKDYDGLLRFFADGHKSSIFDSVFEVDGSDNFCDSANRFCVFGRREKDKVIYTIHSASDGWAGFGLGANMMDADIFVFWKNGDGYTLSRRKAVGHSLPIINSDKSGISIVELDVPAPNWAKIAVSFTKSIDYENRSDPKYIYAMGSSVSDRNSEISSFNFHYTKGEIVGKDFLSNINNSGGSTLTPHDPNMFCDFYAKLPGTMNMFCLYGRPVDQKVLFTIHSSASGWAGIGIGSTMRDADMYIFWKNSTGDGYTVSRRVSDGILMPIYNKDLGQLSIVPLDVPAPDWSQLSVSFSLPFSESLHEKTDFIFAHSNFSVENPDSPQSPFLKHNKKGKISGIDFLSTNAPFTDGSFDVDDGEKRHLIIQIHGILMLFAWSISPFIGIFVARYMKGALGVWWYRIHVFMMLFVTGFFTLAAFALIYSSSDIPLLDTGTHGKMGLSIIIIMVFQIILGFICNALWSKDRVSIPWYDKAHWWIGRIVAILAIINISFGITLYSQMYDEPVGILYAYWICILLGVALLIFGEFKFGQVSKLDFIN